MRTKFKAWTIPYIEEHPEYSLTEEEISKLDNFYLEIGSGKGGFLVEMASRYPKEFFLGIEKNVTCAGITMKKLVENEINNAKLIYQDGQDTIKLIKDKSVKIIFLNFSDPWPKKRHFKRRLTSDNFLSDYNRVLKDDGLIIQKTDNEDLFNYSVEKFTEVGFVIKSKTDDYQEIEEFDAITEYEQNFRNKGMKIHRLVVGK